MTTPSPLRHAADPARAATLHPARLAGVAPAGTATVLPWPRTQAEAPRLSTRLTRLPAAHAVAARRHAVDAIAADWAALSPHARPSFFTSWAWIGTWLDLLPARCDVHLLQACSGERTVGMALLVRGGWRRRAGVPVAPTWHLHATGRAEQDTLYIEHNGFLVDTRFAGQAEAAMLDHWWRRTHGVRELRLPGLAGPGWPTSWWHGIGGAATPVHECHVRAQYSVDLAAVRAGGCDHLASLGAGLRAQLRRSIREYAGLGAMSLTVAGTAADALQWFDRMAALHQARWAGKAVGAFASPWITAFHRRLITEQVPRGGVELLRLRAGDHDVAYLYNFVHDGCVYFYQCGLNYAAVNRHGRPGYVAHTLAIDHYARRGLQVYDFMDGDDRYKRDLANRRGEMSDLILRTPAWRFRIEAWLRDRHHAAREAVPVAIPAPSEAG